MKKIVKILVVMLLAVITTLSMVACSTSTSTGSEKGLLYKKIGGQYTIYKYVDEGLGVTELDISKVLGTEIKDVRIKANAFSGNNTLTKIIVPDTVTLIDKGAFSGMQCLQELVVPFIGMTSIADAEYSPVEQEGKSIKSERTIAHFFGNDSYDNGASVTISYDGTTADSEICYMPLSFKKLTINATSDYAIPMYAFSGLNKQIDIVLEGKITAIGEGAFKDASQLRSIVIPNTVTKIYKDAFNNCAKLTNVTFSTNLETIGEGAFKGAVISDLVLPQSVKTIGDYAFMNSNVKNVTLSASLETIGAYAFYNSIKLEKVYTDGVASTMTIGAFAFSKCDALVKFDAKSVEENKLNYKGFVYNSTAFDK